ncbi:MAG: ribokinase [Microbacterium sp.]
MTEEGHGVVVIGSINHDRTQYVTALPGAGETAIARREVVGLGGKGANQAVAAARAGARTAMVGAVGDDEEGASALRVLADSGVDVGGVRHVGRRTGRATIAVDAAGENTIIVTSGANAEPLDEERTAQVVARAAVVVTQGEIPPRMIDTAAAFAQRSAARFVLNLAPFAVLANETLAAADPLVLNESEAGALLRRGVHELSDVHEAALAAGEIVRRGVRSVVITLGGSGAVVAGDASVHHLPALEGAVVVDTTGAGDAFVGAMCAALSRGEPLSAAAEWGSIAAGLTVTREGAIRSYPSAVELAEAAPRYRRARSQSNPTATVAKEAS